MDELTSVEHWLPIAGYEDLYEISDHGRVWSRRSRRLLTPRVYTRTGHLNVGLNRGGEQVMRRVHLLVLEAFVSPRPAGLWGCHGPGGAGDNRLSNLRWDTPSENVRDRVRDGNHLQANRTQCPQRHDYDAENTYVSKTGQRYCRACRRAYQVSEQGRAAKRLRDARRRGRQRLELQ